MHRIVLMLFFLISGLITAISQTETPNADALFKQAQQLAFSNHWKEARSVAHQVLEINNNYSDARVLIGRTFAWEQNFDSARFEINKVLAVDSSYRDAIDAMIDIEFWAKNYEAALTWCNRGLVYYSNDRDILFKKAKILIAMGREEEARAVLALLLNINPYSYEVNALLASLQKFRNRAIVEHTFDFFREPYVRRWHMTSLQYQRDAKWGTFVGKFNVAQLVTANQTYLSNPDFQLEADAYPILNPQTYVYLNAGYSWGTLFPRFRFGIEPFRTLGNGWEASLGVRYLFYNSAISNVSHVTILTGSIGKYFTKNWISFRPYLVFTHENFSQSYFLFYRHYLGIPENYFGGALGIGSSPDENFTKTADFSKNSLNSYRIRFDYQHKLGKRFILRILTGYTYEKYAVSSYRNRFDTNVYLAYLF
jgi:YaiO family outer membrane protein